MQAGAVPQGAPQEAQAELELILTRVKERFGDGVERMATPFDIPVVKVLPNTLLEACRFLRKSGFNMLTDIGGVDYYPEREPRFEVVYHLMAIPQFWRVRLRVPVGESEAVPSVSAVWPTAAFPEREVYDLFGVRFEGHPDLRRILMPDDWEGYPLRKDYPLQGPRAMEIKPLSVGGRFHAPKLAPEGGLAGHGRS